MARLLAWLSDALVLIFILRMVAGLFSRGPRRASRPAAPPRPERSGGTLVRDPHCGTYVPESRAIRVNIGGKPHFFCSATCKDAYLAASAPTTKGA